MDASHRIVSNSLPNEVDENEENQHKVFANSQNLKKPAAKNYMSSTISAASKAIGPRKKILAERNEGDSEPNNSFDGNAKKNPVLDNFGSLEEANSPDQVSQFSGDDDKEEFLYKPYDPVTNYLSPRPRYLRYNPNRRREILQGGEGGSGESEEGVIGRSGSSSSSLSSGSMVTGEILGEKDGDEEAVGTDEVFEESDEVETEDDEEEKKGWCVEGGMKTVLLLLVFGLSALFITALRCSTPYCELGFYNGIEGCYFGTVNYSLEGLFVKDPESGSVVSHRVALANVAGEGNVIEKMNFEGIDSGDEVKNLQYLGSGELDSEEVAEPEVVFEEASNKVVRYSENQEGLDIFEKVEVSQDQALTFSLQHQDAVSSASNVLEEQKLAEISPVEEVKNRGKAEEFVARSALKEVIQIVESLQEIEAEFALKILIGVVTFFTAVAYFFMGIHVKPKKVGRKDSSSRAKPRSEPLRVEQEKTTKKAHISSPTLEPLMKQHSDQVYHFTTEKDSEEYSQNHAPSVELLSELVVREIKSSAKRNMSTESQSFPLQTRSELLTMDSPLIGSYNNTAEKKAANNKQDLESNFATTQTRRSSRNSEVSAATTPVRRSSRIRSRSILSP